MILAWILGCTTETAGPPPVPTVLDDAAFRFCHVPGANANQAKRWCTLLEGLPEDRCPGLRETCAGRVAEDPVGCEPPGGEGEEDGLAGEPERPPEERKWEGCDSADAEGAQSLMRWVAAIAVAVLVLVVFRLVWTTFGRRPPKTSRPTTAPAPELASPDGTDVPDAPSADLLDAARQALAEGRWADVVLLARATALRRLAEAGRVRLHRSRTDREYVRAVRSDPVVHDELRVVIAATEGVRWEGSPVDRLRATGVLAAAERLLAAVVTGWLVWIALGATPAHAQSYARYAPPGDSALVELFRLYGYDAGWRLRSLGDLDDTTDVLVLDLSGVTVSPEHWAALRTWVQAGAVLIVGSDASEGFPELGTWDIVETGPTRMDPAFADAGLPGPVWPDPKLSVYVDGSARTLVGAGPGAIAVALLDVGAGVVVAIADPTLLWNGAFVHPDNERFLGELVYLGQSLEGWPVNTPARVQLATAAAASAPSSGGGGNNPLGAMANAGLLLFVLQLVATWTLAGVSRGWPFAPLRDPPDAGRLSFVEHVNAIGTRYWRSRDSGYALKQYASLWVARLGVEGLQSAARRAGLAPDAARDWAQQIEVSATAAPEAPSPDHLTRMEELWRITSSPR